MPYVTSKNSLLCKVCSYDAKLSDTDMREKHFMFSLTWGPNMIRSSNGDAVVSEEVVTGYKVFIVDENVQPVKEIGTVPRDPRAQPVCCTKSAYFMSVTGYLEPNFHRFMIVPCQGDLCLPAGVLSDVIVDGVSGHGTKIDGLVELGVDDALGFANNLAVEPAVKKAIAESVPGAILDWVHLTNISSTSRRLEGAVRGWLTNPRAGSRQLAAGHVSVFFSIYLPPEYLGPAITKATVSPTTLQSNMNIYLQRRGLSYKVTAVKVHRISAVPLGEQTTSVARRSANTAGIPLLLKAFMAWPFLQQIS